MVIAPHLDDAVLSAWLVLRSTAGARVVTCFAGIPAEGVIGGSDGAPGRLVVEGRRAEDVRAISRMGGVPVHLDALDAQYRSASDDLTVARMAELLEPELQRADDVWIPAGIGGHVDHLLARDAALVARPTATRYWVYGDLPYAARPAWPSAVTGSPRDAALHLASKVLRPPTPRDKWSAAISEFPGGRVPHVLRLTPHQRREKLQAVGDYTSQLAVLRLAPRNRMRRRQIFAYEVFWALPPHA